MQHLIDRRLLFQGFPQLGFLGLERGDVAHDHQHLPVGRGVEIVFRPDPAWHSRREGQFAGVEDRGAPLGHELVLRRVEPVIAAAPEMPQDVLMRPPRDYQFRRHVEQAAGAVGVLQNDPIFVHQHDRIGDVGQHVLGA